MDRLHLDACFDMLNCNVVEAPEDVDSSLHRSGAILLHAVHLALPAHFGVNGEVAAQLSAVLECNPDQRVNRRGEEEDVDREGKHQNVGEEVGVRYYAGE